VLTRHADAETFADPGSVMRLPADSVAPDGFTSCRSASAEGAVGAPAHFHTRATELFSESGERFDNHHVDSPAWRAELERPA
jgi:hypothetical protein